MEPGRDGRVRRSGPAMPAWLQELALDWRGTTKFWAFDVNRISRTPPVP